MYENEIWKPISRLNDLLVRRAYYANQYGHIKSVNLSNNTFKIIREFNQNEIGYCRFTVCINSINRTFYVHQLVADAWLPNPDNLPYINHKNEIKYDNRVENLEWCTAKYNSTYNNIRKRAGDTKAIPVKVYNTNGEYIDIFRSGKEASEFTKVPRGSISLCLRGKEFSAKGYIFIKEYNGYPLSYYLNNIRMKKIEQYKDNHLIAVYNSIVEASEITGIDDASISKCVNGDLNTAGGFIWKHKTYE